MEDGQRASHRAVCLDSTSQLLCRVQLPLQFRVQDTLVFHRMCTFSCSLSNRSEAFQILTYALLGEAEISNSNVPFLVENYVLWLEVSVDDVVLVQALKGKYDFGCVEARPVLCEALLLA